MIPAGVYALEDVIFTGNWTRPNTNVTFDTGVVTTGLRHIRTSLRINASDPTTAPIADFTQASNTMLLDDGVWLLFNFPIIDYSTLGVEDQGALIVRNGSRVLGSVPQPITNGACTLSVTVDGPDSQCGQLAVNPGTGTVIVRVTGGPGMVFAAPTNGGQFLVAGAMGQLPAIFVAGDFFGATNPDGVMFVVDTSGGPVTCLNMRAAAQCAGSFVAFKKSNDANALTILTGSADTIDGSPSYTVAAANGEVTLVSDGVSNWMVQSTDGPWQRDSAPTPGITSLVNPTDSVVIGPSGFGNAQALHVIKDTQAGFGTEIAEIRGLAVPGSFNVLELQGAIFAFASFFKWSTVFAANTEFALAAGSGTQNDVAINGCFNTVQPSGGGLTITGLDPALILQTGFPIAWIFNKGTANLTLTNEDAGSSATNRFQLIGANLVIPPNGGVLITRIQMPSVGNAQRWVVLLRSN